MQALGFLINWDKSERVPTQCPIFLGATIDIPRQLARPSPRRIATIVAAARLLRGRRQPAAFSQELLTGPGPPIQTGPPAPDDPPPLPEVEPSGIPALWQPIEGPPTHHNGDLGHLPHGMGGGGGGSLLMLMLMGTGPATGSSPFSGARVSGCHPVTPSLPPPCPSPHCPYPHGQRHSGSL